MTDDKPDPPSLESTEGAMNIGRARRRSALSPTK